MRIFIISNTEFGHKNHKSFMEYFIKDFSPYIQQNASNEDILLHMGGLFFNKSYNMTTIGADVFHLFNLLSDYLNIKFVVSEKDRTKFNHSNTMLMFENHSKMEVIKEIKKYEDFEIIPFVDKLERSKNISFYNNSVIIDEKVNKFNSPYQLSEKDENKKIGFYIYNIETQKFSFKENKYTKKFITIDINNDEDLETLKNEDFENKVHININKSFYLNNQNKIDVKLSKFNIHKTSLVGEKIEQDELLVSSNLEKNIIDEINKLENSDKIMEEFNKIYEIYKNKIN